MLIQDIYNYISLISKSHSLATMTYGGFVSLRDYVSVGLMIGPVYGGKAETETQTQTIPIEGEILSGGCPGAEDVVYSGTIRTVTHITIDPNGGVHEKIQVNFVNFKGIGQTSGDEYHLRSTTGTQTFFSEDGSPATLTVTANLRITDGISEKAKITGQLTVNANGEVTVERITSELDCD